ncbi:hypothetical protein N8987_05795 [Crocinitomix sp.]|nr:hypothetical protein [Crocinitomix sp.]
MKNFKDTCLLFVVLSGLIVSCNPAEQYKSEIAQIDSCLNVLDSLTVLFDGIEFDSLELMVAHVENNEAQIKQLYQPDTLMESFGNLMNESKTVRKKLSVVGKDQLAIGDELDTLKHQFGALKMDILNGLFDDQQIVEYLTIEKAALSKVDAAFSNFYQMQKKEKSRYYYTVPELDAFIEILKTKNEALD